MARRDWRNGALALAVTLAACGGEGDPAPAPNAAPTFTSSSSGSVVENMSGTAYQASASDADGDSVTYTISGGEDAARFTISPAGAVQFSASPNFEAPADANGDNAFLLEITASDGKTSVRQSVEIRVTNSLEGVSVRRVATGLTGLAALTQVPGQDGMFVGFDDARVSLLDPGTGGLTPVATLPGRRLISGFSTPTLINLVAAPDYQTSRAFYAIVLDSEPRVNPGFFVRYYHYPTGGANMVYTEVFGAQGLLGLPQWVGVGPDGLIYVLSSAAAGTSTPTIRTASVQRISKNFTGTCSGATCFIPAPGNPFSGADGDPFVFHYGLRSPNGGSFHNGLLLFADAQPQPTQSEINAASTTNGGASYGWPFVSGTTRIAAGGSAAPLDPSLLYDGAAIGGFVYNGPIASLNGKYIHGLSNGDIRTIGADALAPGVLRSLSQTESRRVDFTPDAGTLNGLRYIVSDRAGNIWLATTSGDVFQVRATG